jgi:type IV pilus assembly protein PilN
VRQQNKIKFLSGFAFKGLAATIAAIYLILIGYSLILYNSNKEKLKEFAEVEAKIKIINAKYEKLTEQKNKMDASMAITNMINSNQEQSFRALAQVARSVPTRVKLNKIEYNGEKEVIIRGLAFDPLDVINFNATLKRKSLIVDSEIKQNNRDNTDQSKSKSMKYAFEIRCTLDFSENRKKT